MIFVCYLFLLFGLDSFVLTDGWVFIDFVLYLCLRFACVALGLVIIKGFDLCYVNLVGCVGLRAITGVLIVWFVLFVVGFWCAVCFLYYDFRCS